MSKKIKNTNISKESQELRKPRICVPVLFILCLTWTGNANSLKQNIIVLKEICSWLPPFCKQILLLFTQPRRRSSIAVSSKWG